MKIAHESDHPGRVVRASDSARQVARLEVQGLASGPLSEDEDMTPRDQWGTLNRTKKNETEIAKSDYSGRVVCCPGTPKSDVSMDQEEAVLATNPVAVAGSTFTHLSEVSGSFLQKPSKKSKFLSASTTASTMETDITEDPSPDDIETPGERPTNIDKLRDVLDKLQLDDLDSLLQIRDSLEAKCKELRLQADRKKQQDACSRLPNISFAEDGNRTPSELSDWIISRELGSGRYAKVFSAKHRSSSDAQVVKVIEKKVLSSKQDWINANNEHGVLCKIGKHPNIAKLTGALQSQERIYFFMEFVKGKDLFDFLKLRQQNRSPVPKDAVVKIFSSIASALSTCHRLGFCHRDLKPENIIVQQNYVAKLIDFGCACSRSQLESQCVGTMPFIAPECMLECVLDGAPADVWSFGVILLEIVHGLRALSNSLGWDTTEKSMQETGSQLTTVFQNPVQGLAVIRSALKSTPAFEGDETLACMLHADPSQRPMAEALCEAAWLHQ